MLERSYDYDIIKNNIDNLFKISEYKENIRDTDKYVDTLLMSKNILTNNVINTPNKFIHYYIPDIVSNNLCDLIINESEKYALINGWTTTRHKNYPTTDIQVVNISNIQTFVFNLIKYDIFPLISEKYNVSKYLLDCNDIFVVKYDTSAQSELAYHKDGSMFSFNILLNHPSEFEGGGTYIQNENNSILVPNTKGGLILHSGQCLHSGNKITQGKRYILVGFVNYLKTYFINININTSLNNKEKIINSNNFSISSSIMPLLDDITRVSSNGTFLLDINKNNFNVIEKFVYDITLFHLKRLGKSINGDKKYYSEFWWRTLNINKDKIISHNFHHDKDETIYLENNKLIHPLMSTVTYFDNSKIPTIIINETNKILLSFPLNNKHLSFNSECYHGVVKVFDNIPGMKENESRKTLMINIWEDHIPKKVDFFKENDINNGSNQLFCKENTIVNLDEDININYIKLSSDIISKLITNIKIGKHKLNMSIFNKLIDIDKIRTINMCELSNDK